VREQLEAMLRSGEASSVVEAAERTFSAAPSPTAEATWIAIAAMRACADQKAWGKVIVWAEKGLSLKLLDQEALGWIQLFLGVAQMYLGNVYRAEKALAAFRRIANKTPGLERLLPYGLYNWATLMRFLHRHDEEVKRLRQAARSFKKQHDYTRMLQCQLAIVWSNLLRGLSTPAMEEWRRLKPDLDRCDDVEVHINAQLAWALYQSLLGNIQDSDTICCSLRDRDDLLVGQRIDALWILGCNARARGDMALAMEYATEARRLARQDYWPPQAARLDALTLRTVVN
jgi:tetratricopeptide (TPR) repeat protein